ncbi:MAG: hypothetical protein MJE77_10945 [Proteobacteria bacterium]|nr:hypothetical protein [Pseudomonadota bacterium]
MLLILGLFRRGVLLVSWCVDLVEGLKNAPSALRSLFEGANIGKLAVKVSDEPS